MLICLFCLTAGCGRYEKKHALSHVGQNKDHSLVLQSRSMTVWCYDCDDDIQSILNQMQNEDAEKDNLNAFLEKIHEIFGRVLIKNRVSTV